MCDHDNIKIPFGSAKEHGAAHERNHQQWSRRSFLSSLGALGGGAALGALPLKNITASPLLAALSSGDSDRILILVQLKGGNDGLNTIIPLYDYGNYESARPNIAVAQNDVLELNGSVGIPNWMSAAHDMWNEDQMKVIQAVGYPDPNLSHFRSTDIWSSSSDSDEVISTGWLGRYIENSYPDLINNPPECPPAIQIGAQGNISFQGSTFNLAVSVSNPERLEEIAMNGELYSLDDLPDDCYGQELEFMRTITNNTFHYADSIHDAFENGSNDVSYQNNSFASQMALVARMIKGNLGTRLYLVSLNGFDTHADQYNNHNNLLNQLAEGMRALHQDLEGTSYEDKVLSMTVSEFGRRVGQNASNGTDHGTAAPLMLFGKGVNGSGVIGEHPDLSDVDAAGNLMYAIDFRRIYATVLEHWMCLDPDLVNALIGDEFERIPDMVLDCSAISGTGGGSVAELISHRAMYGNGKVMLQYNLPRTSNVEVAIFNLDGRKLFTLYKGQQAAGRHYASLDNNRHQVPAGNYIYSILTERGNYSSQFLIH